MYQRTRSKATKKIEPTKPVCTIHEFTGTTLPQAYRDQILDSTHWDAMCRSSVPWEDGSYPTNAIDSAQILLVATVDAHEWRHLYPGHGGLDRSVPDIVVGFLCGLTHTFLTSLDGRVKPVAEPHEWYLDVVCTLPGGCGRKLIEQFMGAAMRNGKRQIRLYAVEAAYNIWKRYGFTECEDNRPGAGTTPGNCFRRTYKADPGQGVRMTRWL